MHSTDKKVAQACGSLMCSKVLRPRDMKRGLVNAYACVVDEMRRLQYGLHGGMMKMFHSYIIVCTTM